jgi:nucleotide-binding universal stress UspA family protein
VTGAPGAPSPRPTGEREDANRRRLVFGDDGSRGADIAWLWINNHPWPGWRIDVLTGAEPPYLPSTWGTSPTTEPWTPPWSRKYLDSAQPVEVSCRHAETDPRILLDQQSDADLVVVGHAGVGHLRSLWIGSTTEWLLHHPTAPLAIVRSAAAVQHVVCCIDGSACASRALEAFLTLPLAAGTDVTLLCVDDGRVDVDQALSAACITLQAAGTDPHVERARGKPTHTILEHLHAHQPQLAVLGTKGLTGWRRLRLGSTAAAVVHHAACTSLVACANQTIEEDEHRV